MKDKVAHPGLHHERLQEIHQLAQSLLGRPPLSAKVKPGDCVRTRKKAAPFLLILSRVVTGLFLWSCYDLGLIYAARRVFGLVISGGSRGVLGPVRRCGWVGKQGPGVGFGLRTVRCTDFVPHAAHNTVVRGDVVVVSAACPGLVGGCMCRDWA